MDMTPDKLDLIIQALETVIDTRYKYLKELDYENHSYARKVKEELYMPAVQILKEAIEKTA